MASMFQAFGQQTPSLPRPAPAPQTPPFRPGLVAPPLEAEDPRQFSPDLLWFYRRLAPWLVQPQMSSDSRDREWSSGQREELTPAWLRLLMKIRQEQGGIAL